MKKYLSLKIFKPLDIVIIIIAGALVTASFYFTLTNRDAGATLIVTDTDGEWVYDLHTDTTIGGKGPLGVSVIIIQQGEAFFASSPCDNQICVHSYPIHTNANFIACLPNQVFIRIEAEEENSKISDLDIISY